jgi:hypothetical protein
MKDSKAEVCKEVETTDDYSSRASQAKETEQFVKDNEIAAINTGNETCASNNVKYLMRWMIQRLRVAKI